MVEKKTVICFEVLGALSYTSSEGEEEAGAVRTAPKKIGKKTLSFLEYLIVNHARSISAEELTDTFWEDEKSRDPANALRNMVHKTRNLLKVMFPDEKEELLQTLCGCYVWNPDVTIRLDVEQFEKECLTARKYPGREGMESLRSAVSLYKGDLLAGNDSDWVRGLRQYYRALYLDACKALLPLLEEDEAWMEVISVCGQAFQINFCTEEFTSCQMRAFMALGQPKQALERYEELKRRMLKELGMPPTDQIEQLRTLALETGRKDSGDEGEIFRLACREEPWTQAFFCSFSIFQSIVALERRHLARSGLISTLVIVRLGESTAQTADIKRLERVLVEGLRTGDPVARLSAGSYILMLSGTDAHNAQVVTNRIDSSFHRTYRHSNARLLFRISALEPQKSKNSDQILDKNNR